MTDLSWPLQRKLLRAKGIGFNTEVYNWFKDVTENESLKLDTGTRGKLRNSLLILPKDSRTSAMFKIQYFREFVQRVQNRPSIYGIPPQDFQEDVSFRPYVYFYFSQDSSAVPVGKSAIQGEYGFRLVDETSATMTEAKAKTIATKIKSIFVSNGSGITFKKGKIKVTYLDKKNGYDFRLNSLTKLDGENLVKKFLEIKGDTYNADLLGEHNPNKSSIINPTGTRTVYGKQVDNKRWRPTATVRFKYASLQIDGLSDDVLLIDLTGKQGYALIR